MSETDQDSDRPPPPLRIAHCLMYSKNPNSRSMYVHRLLRITGVGFRFCISNTSEEFRCANGESVHKINGDPWGLVNHTFLLDILDSIARVESYGLLAFAPSNANNPLRIRLTRDNLPKLLLSHRIYSDVLVSIPIDTRVRLSVRSREEPRHRLNK